MAKKGLRMRRSLFGASPEPRERPVSEWSVSDIEAIITPDSKANDSGLGSDAKFSTIKIQSFTPLCKRVGVRKKLFSNKRPAVDQEIDDLTPATKKLRDLPTHLSMSESTPQQGTTIVDAVEHLTSKPDLIADGSSNYSLPTIPGKSKEYLNGKQHRL